MIPESRDRFSERIMLKQVSGEGPIAMMTAPRTARLSGRASALRTAVLALLALSLAQCTGGRLAVLSGNPPSVRATPQRQVQLPPGQEREHLRILTAYGGAYEDQRLQAMLDRTVDKLVAAS